MNVEADIKTLAPKDFASDQEVRWCPGCGDYAILKGVQKALADIGTATEKTVFVSGIGCAARFPYYVSTYGFHTIHGRAPAFATGIKVTNPELDVWLVSGDGDALSIGGNHLIHLLRRNLDLQFLLFNNEIYGLTKGQYSPTSRFGTRTPSSPLGSAEHPISASQLALGAGGRFIARAIDRQQKQLPHILERAHAFKGTAFVEIFQNCIVYNDGVFSDIVEKDVARDHQVYVEHGRPLIFGADGDKGLRLKPGVLELEVVTVGENGVGESDILVHDETNRPLAQLLAGMNLPDFPVAIGVLYCEPADTYEDIVHAQINTAKASGPAPDLNGLLREAHTWEVHEH